MVDVADVVAEEFAHSEQQVPVDDLARGEQPAYHMVYDLARVDFAYLHPLRLPEEVLLRPEYLMHGVDLGTGEYVRCGGLVFGVQLAEHLLHQAACPVPVLGQHYVLELVQEDIDLASALAGCAVWQGQRGSEVVLVEFPVEGEYLPAVCVSLGVEDEVRARQQRLHDGGVVLRGAVCGVEHFRAQPRGQVPERPDVEQADAGGDEVRP